MKFRSAMPDRYDKFVEQFLNDYTERKEPEGEHVCIKKSLEDYLMRLLWKVSNQKKALGLRREIQNGLSSLENVEFSAILRRRLRVLELANRSMATRNDVI